MSIQMINTANWNIEFLPDKLGGIFNPGIAEGLQNGYLQAPILPVVADGYTRVWGNPPYCLNTDPDIITTITTDTSATSSETTSASTDIIIDRTIAKAIYIDRLTTDVDAENAAKKKAEDQIIIDAKNAHDLKVATQRATYRTYVSQFCQYCNMPIPDSGKFTDESIITQKILEANAVGNMTLATELGMIAVGMDRALTELRRPSMDGDDAWERI